MNDIEKIKLQLREFAQERNWEQYHSPKNLAMALSVEVSEIVEIFQWLTQEESRNLPPDKVEKVKEEIGDVMIFLTSLADKLDIDPIEAAHDKIKINNKKYPVEKAKGSAKKYKDL